LKNWLRARWLKDARLAKEKVTKIVKTNKIQTNYLKYFNISPNIRYKNYEKRENI
jgi:hypothetical protein